MNSRSVRIQWLQLLVLSGVHFSVDMFGNMLPAILPAVLREFALTLSLGTVVLSSLTLTSNGVQLLTGHMRPGRSGPLFLHIGLVLAASICLLAVIPRSTIGIPLIIGLAAVSGCGIAIAHPEGLRAVHGLDGIAPQLSTAVFMTSGLLGFASGGAISAALVSSFGLKGLYPLALCPVVGMLAICLARVRLSTDGDRQRQGGPTPAAQGLAFRGVMLIGLPAAVSTTVVVFLIPTYLDGIGFELTFGGLSAAMFGWGGVVGPFAWAVMARRKGDLPCATVAFLSAFPLLVAYLLLIRSRHAIWLLFGVGFCSMSAYILTITLARHSSGLNLGQRMGFIVGGTWGFAAVVFMALGPIADRFGSGIVLMPMPLGYLLSGLLAMRIMRRHPTMARTAPRISVAETVAEERPPV